MRQLRMKESQVILAKVSSKRFEENQRKIVDGGLCELLTQKWSFYTFWLIKRFFVLHRNWSEGSYFIIRFWFQAWNMSGTLKVSVSLEFETFVVISTRVIRKTNWKSLNLFLDSWIYEILSSFIKRCNLSLFGVVKWRILETPHSVKVNGKGDKTDIFDKGIVYSSSRPKQHHSSLT